MIGNLTASVRRPAGAPAKTTAGDAEAAAPLAAAAGPEEPGERRRRQRARAQTIGRGYGYMDLEPSETGWGRLGFAGTAAGGSGTAAAGLATLADDEFGSGPRMPLVPGTWDADPAQD